MASSSQIPLPFEAKLLVPFVLTYNAAPKELRGDARDEHIAQAMHLFDNCFKKEKVVPAVEALEMALGALDREMEPAPRVIGPMDQSCIVCGHTPLKVTSSCVRVFLCH